MLAVGIFAPLVIVAAIIFAPWVRYTFRKSIMKKNPFSVGDIVHALDVNGKPESFFDDKPIEHIVSGVDGLAVWVNRNGRYYTYGAHQLVAK